MKVGALSGLRVVELAEGVAGEYCGRLLAALGADVIKVEQPRTGSPTRHMPPLVLTGADPERSALFAYLNAGKASVTVDRDAPAEVLATLLKDADAVIDDHGAIWLSRHSLDPAALGERYPALVVCSITPFGNVGDAVTRHATELTVIHASGWGYHTPSAADPTRPPLSGAGRFLADYEAGLDGALATTAALLDLEASGCGQFIDVSAQAVLVSRNDYVVAQMVAGDMPVGDHRDAFDLGGPAGIFACREGHAYLWMSSPQHWEAFSTLLGNPDWMRDFPERWLERECTPERVALCRQHIADWLSDKDRIDVSARAQSLGLTMVPVNAPSDLIASPQYQHRRYFNRIRHPALNTDHCPGEPFALSATPVRSERAAPQLGADNRRLDSPWIAREPRCGVGDRQRQGPLAGVRVVELTKVWAGPCVGKLMALLGAEVIRVESENSLDVTRVFGVTDINDAPGFKAVNPQKLSVQIDMKSEQGAHLIRQLIARADVLVENLRPGAIDRLGLGAERLRRINPQLVYVAMSMWGNDGPLAYQTGYAPCFAALGGLSARVGYPGEPPAAMNIRYADSTFGAFTALGALAALRHCRVAGEGQFVDVSAVESMSSMIGDAFVEFLVSGELAAPSGNRRADMAPHGVWRCADDQWLSIAVANDGQWRQLAALPDIAVAADDPRFATVQARKTNEDALDEIIAQWCLTGDADAFEQRLQALGIAALRSRHSLDLISDATLWARGLYVEVTDARGQSKPTMGAPWVLGRGASLTRAAPDLGQHNAAVLGGIIGLSDDQQQHLAEIGVVR